jgi:VanZ family protein
VSSERVLRPLSRIGLVAWVVVLLWASLAPGQYVPGMASVSDKLLHLVAYLVLGVLAVFALPSIPPLAILAGIAVFGLGLEVLQYFTGYRTFEWTDFLADVVGAGIGMTAALVARDVLRRRP